MKLDSGWPIQYRPHVKLVVYIADVAGAVEVSKEL